MPIGIQRLNQRSLHPNDRIVFIKALPGPDESKAVEFLQRVAAICVPIMKKAGISVMTLEEHEPNREFLGRNFNAGEIIQLVLKNRAGRWLPMTFVQSVMMHELAHCHEMNHGRNFWKKNNQFRGELKELRDRGYTGEGIWGRGRSLFDGQLSSAGPLGEGDMPQSLCGGTYRSRGRKRKRGRGTDASNDSTDRPTYAERKQKWIRKKFGEGGQSVGDDEYLRVLMERGKEAGKPRVAKSKRGRDLRAAAALLRFEQDKSRKKQDALERHDSDLDQTSDSDFEDGYDDDDDDEHGEIDAIDTNGEKLVDFKGRALIKVCEDTDIEDNDEARREMEELGLLNTDHTDRATSSRNHSHTATESKELVPIKNETTDYQETPDIKTATLLSTHQPLSLTGKPLPPPVERPSTVSIGSISFNPPAIFPSFSSSSPTSPIPSRPQPQPHENTTRPPSSPPHMNIPILPSNAQQPQPQTPRESATPVDTQICTVCSLENGSMALTCLACAHVLDVERLPLHWRCPSPSCAKVGYTNSLDVGVCGLCGVRNNHKAESESE